MKRIVVALLLVMVAPAVTLGVSLTIAPSNTAGPSIDSLDDGSGFYSFLPGIVSNSNNGNLSAYGEFDLSSIPTGATINSAVLRFGYTIDPFGVTTPVTYDINIFTYNGSALGGTANGTISDSSLANGPTDFGAGALFTNITGSSTSGTTLYSSIAGLGTVVGNNFATATQYLGIRWSANVIATDVLLGPHSADAMASTPILEIDYTAPNSPPTANAGLLPYSVGNSVSLDGTNSLTYTGAPNASELAQSITNYAWTPTGRPTVNSATGTTNLSITQTGITSAGGAGSSNTVSLVVTDSAGGVSTNTAQQTMTYNNQAPTATVGANGQFFFNTASVNLSGTGTDPDMALNGFSDGLGPNLPGNFEQIMTYTWRNPSNAIVSSSQNPTITFAQAVAAGMVNTTTPGSLNLQVSDKAGVLSTVSGSSTLLLQYNNAAPDAATASVVDGVGGKTFNASLTDVDLSVNGTNGAAANFEYVDWEFDSANDGFGGGFVSGQLLANGNPSQFVTNAILNAEFGSPGVKTGYFTVRDRAGLTDTFTFTFQIAAIPEPMTLAIWSVFGVAAVGFVIRRKRK